MSFTLASCIGSKGTEGFVGLAALERAREAGYTDEEIKEMLKKENLQLAEKAKENFLA